MKNDILHHLLKRKISEYQFSKDIGVSRQAVNLWIKQLHEPKPSTRKKIAEYFGVPPSEIFFV